jgi:hypothetical protein
MADTYRTDRPRLTDSDGYRIPRLTVIVGSNLSKADKEANKVEREKFEDRYGSVEEDEERCEHCDRRKSTKPRGAQQ